MKKLYVALLAIILICFTGCEDKKYDANSTIKEGSTQVLTDKNIKRMTGTFTLKNAKNNTHSVEILEKELFFSDVEQPLLLIYLFPSDCSSCVTNLMSFIELQKQYKKQLFIASIEFNNKKSTFELSSKDKVNFHVSSLAADAPFVQTLQNSLHIDVNLSKPLTVIYKNGHLYSYFEGLVPIEMIKHDIQQAKE